METTMNIRAYVQRVAALSALVPLLAMRMAGAQSPTAPRWDAWLGCWQATLPADGQPQQPAPAQPQYQQQWTQPQQPQNAPRPQQPSPGIGPQYGGPMNELPPLAGANGQQFQPGKPHRNMNKLVIGLLSTVAVVLLIVGGGVAF